MIKKIIFIFLNLFINNFYCSIKKKADNFFSFNNIILNHINLSSIQKQNNFYIDFSKIDDKNGPLVEKSKLQLKIESLKFEKNKEDELINFFRNSKKKEDNKLLLFRTFYRSFEQTNSFNDSFDYLKKEEKNSVAINFMTYGETSLIATIKAKNIYNDENNDYFFNTYNTKKFHYWNNDRKAFFDSYEIYKVNEKIKNNIKNGKKGISVFL